MMKIFIADYLPIKNKGEEALLRGIQSLYEEKYHTDVELQGAFLVFSKKDILSLDSLKTLKVINIDSSSFIEVE